MKTDRKNYTIRDIAAKANVSIATVSRVINNSALVKPKTKEKITKIIEKNWFQPNKAAQNLARNNKLSGLIVMPNYERVYTSSVGNEIMRGIADGVAEEDKIVNFIVMDFFSKMSKTQIENLSEYEFVLFVDIPLKEVSLYLKNIKTKVMLINHYTGKKPVSCISIDNIKGVEVIVNYLSAIGHKEIAIVNGDTYRQTARERFAGFKKGLKKNGLILKKNFVLNARYKYEVSYKLTLNMLKKKKKPTAIIAASDWMAFGVYKAVKEAGLKIPKDISVTGYDNSLYTPIIEPSLTSVHQPLYELGYRGVKEIIKLNSKNDITKVKLDPELIVRESCCPVL